MEGQEFPGRGHPLSAQHTNGETPMPGVGKVVRPPKDQTIEESGTRVVPDLLTPEDTGK